MTVRAVARVFRELAARQRARGRAVSPRAPLLCRRRRRRPLALPRFPAWCLLPPRGRRRRGVRVWLGCLVAWHKGETGIGRNGGSDTLWVWSHHPGRRWSRPARGRGGRWNHQATARAARTDGWGTLRPRLDIDEPTKGTRDRPVTQPLQKAIDSPHKRGS